MHEVGGDTGDLHQAALPLMPHQQLSLHAQFRNANKVTVGTLGCDQNLKHGGDGVTAQSHLTEDDDSDEDDDFCIISPRN